MKKRTTPKAQDKARRKAMALRAWEKLNPDRLKYEMAFTATETVSADQLHELMHFTRGHT
jgi:hypothetical protein